MKAKILVNKNLGLGKLTDAFTVRSSNIWEEPYMEVFMSRTMKMRMNVGFERML